MVAALTLVTSFESELPSEPNFEFLVKQGRAINWKIGQGKWDLGDLGIICEAADLGTLAELAIEIDIAPRTFQNHVAVAKFWPQGIRQQYNHLHHTHFKTARQFAYGDLPTALGYLDHADKDNLNCNAFYQWLNENKKSRESLLCEVLGELVDWLEDDERDLNFGTEKRLIERARAVLADSKA